MTSRASEPAPAAQTRVDWRIYRGTGTPHGDIRRLPEPPPYRRFSDREPGSAGAVDPGEGAEPTAGGGSGPMVDGPVSWHPGIVARARLYRPDPHTVDMVNAALYLRRPLLVTGKPGTGKSTLAYSVSHELGLGPVLHWPITSRSTLADALYRYDAIGRLQDTNLRRADDPDVGPVDIGRYVQLGPLGTALVPTPRPRVLLIDEFDKSDVDLPNDLLHVFEEGRFEIPELARLPEEEPTVEVRSADPGVRVPVTRGQVACDAFPLVIVTSNAEKEFPPAFLRRCLRLYVAQPDAEKVAAIVGDQLGPEARERGRELIARFIARRDRAELATDQLLNAIALAMADPARFDNPEDGLLAAILRPINAGNPGT